MEMGRRGAFVFVARRDDGAGRQTTGEADGEKVGGHQPRGRQAALGAAVRGDSRKQHHADRGRTDGYLHRAGQGNVRDQDRRKRGGVCGNARVDEHGRWSALHHTGAEGRNVIWIQWAFVLRRRQDRATLWSDSTSRGMSAAVLDAGSEMIALGVNSELVVFEPSGKEYKELAKLKVANTETWAHPVLAGNRIFIRDHDSVSLLTTE